MTPRHDHPALAALSVDLGLGPDPGAVLTPLTALYAQVDAAAARGAQGLDLPCRVGCDACCHEAVFVSAPEFLAVAAFLLETESSARRATIVRCMTQLAARFEDEIAMLETFEPGPERDEVATRIKFRCPLLDGEGRCSVYPVRELNARTFGVGWDEAREAAYGCELSHARLRVLPASASVGLVRTRAARRGLRDQVPGAGPVRVYPWWFSRYGHHLVGR